jgi:hypothetical protein
MRQARGDAHCGISYDSPSPLTVDQVELMITGLHLGNIMTDIRINIILKQLAIWEYFENNAVASQNRISIVPLK